MGETNFDKENFQTWELFEEIGKPKDKLLWCGFPKFMNSIDLTWCNDKFCSKCRFRKSCEFIDKALHIFQPFIKNKKRKFLHEILTTNVEAEKLSEGIKSLNKEFKDMIVELDYSKFVTVLNISYRQDMDLYKIDLHTLTMYKHSGGQVEESKEKKIFFEFFTDSLSMIRNPFSLWDMEDESYYSLEDKRKIASDISDNIKRFRQVRFGQRAIRKEGNS